MQNAGSGLNDSAAAGSYSQFHRLPEVNQKACLENLNTYCCGKPDDITAQMAKTSLTATICAPGCIIHGKIERKKGSEGDEMLLVPIKTAPLQIETISISVEYLKSLIRSSNQPLAQPA